MADAIQAVRTQPARWGPERVGPEREPAPARRRESMAADNHTTIVGNLVEDPEVRFTNTGIAVTNLRVAVTQRVQQDGRWRDAETSFFKVNVWRDQAEHPADSLTKGDRVMVTGRLRQRSWETPEGEKRSVTELEADEVGASLSGTRKWTARREPCAKSATPPAAVQGRRRALSLPIRVVEPAAGPSVLSGTRAA
jgi:single stranded DNA-binding protein